MATKIGLAEKIADITKCSICLETLKNPKQLPCIHTFCLQCLQALVQDKNEENKITCPLCRKISSIPVGGIEKFATNFFMIQLIEVNKLETGKDTEDKSIRCELCSEPDLQVIATSFCIECNQHFCDQCSLIHSKLKMSKAHEMVHAKDIPRVEERVKMAVSYCELHPKEEIKLYCNDCKIVTCLMCYVEHHNKHECSDIKNCAAKFSEQLHEDVGKIAKCTSEGKKILKEVETNRKELLRKFNGTENEIGKRYNKMLAVMKSHRSQLLKELDLLKEDILKKIETRKDEVERHIVIMDTFARYCQQMKEKGTACDISRAANDLHARAEELMKSHQQEEDVKLIQVEYKLTPVAETIKNVTNFIGNFVFNGQATMKKKNDELGDIAAIKNNDDLAAKKNNDDLAENKNIEDLMAKKINADSEMCLYKPKIHRVMPTTGHIYGIAVLESQLFVIQERFSSTEGSVDIYCAKNFTLKHNIKIPGSMSLQAIASCHHNNCLYLSDAKHNTIYRYDVSKEFVKYLNVTEASWGLSVTKECFNLLITFHMAREIHKYSSNGIFLRKISLDSSMHSLHHCVHLTGDQFAVSYGENGASKCGVVVIDSSGSVIRSYEGHSGTDVGQMGNPRSLAADRQGNILVVDVMNSRIEQLSPTLMHLGYIEIPIINQSVTQNLYLDEPNNALYTGQGSNICWYSLN